METKPTKTDLTNEKPVAKSGGCCGGHQDTTSDANQQHQHEDRSKSSKASPRTGGCTCQ